jgi:hypothetical protein
MKRSRPQRIVLIIYCLMLVYCCVWIPWHGHVKVKDKRRTSL